MYYEIAIKNTIIDKRGNEKEVTTKFIVENQELFAEAEQKGLEQNLVNGDVVAIKRSAIREMVNEPTNQEGEAIYFATIVDTFITDNGDEKQTKYTVGLYALSVTNANTIVEKYMAQGLNDMECQQLKKTQFVEVI